MLHVRRPEGMKLSRNLLKETESQSVLSAAVRGCLSRFRNLASHLRTLLHRFFCKAQGWRTPLAQKQSKDRTEFTQYHLSRKCSFARSHLSTQTTPLITVSANGLRWVGQCLRLKVNPIHIWAESERDRSINSGRAQCRGFISFFLQQFSLGFHFFRV